jgi:hypothetical protein
MRYAPNVINLNELFSLVKKSARVVCLVFGARGIE